MLDGWTFVNPRNSFSTKYLLYESLWSEMNDIFHGHLLHVMFSFSYNTKIDLLSWITTLDLKYMDIYFLEYSMGQAHISILSLLILYLMSNQTKIVPAWSFRFIQSVAIAKIPSYPATLSYTMIHCSLLCGRDLHTLVHSFSWHDISTQSLDKQQYNMRTTLPSGDAFRQLSSTFAQFSVPDW